MAALPALRSHVAVAADGRFCGYVSGGCVEAAVAAEALIAIAEGKDRAVAFGAGSPFFDIVLPCGGGIMVAIHVLSDITAVDEALDCLGRREPAAIRYSPARQMLPTEVPTPVGSLWMDDDFISVYHPQTRLIISGTSLEAHAVETLGTACGYDVVTVDAFCSSKSIAEAIDSFTAVLLLHHDLDAERQLLEAGLCSCPFYIGALGSSRTHRKRTERLQAFPKRKLPQLKRRSGCSARREMRCRSRYRYCPMWLHPRWSPMELPSLQTRGFHNVSYVRCYNITYVNVCN